MCGVCGEELIHLSVCPRCTLSLCSVCLPFHDRDSNCLPPPSSTVSPSSLSPSTSSSSSSVAFPFSSTLTDLRGIVLRGDEEALEQRLRELRRKIGESDLSLLHFAVREGKMRDCHEYATSHLQFAGQDKCLEVLLNFSDMKALSLPSSLPLNSSLSQSLSPSSLSPPSSPLSSLLLTCCASRCPYDRILKCVNTLISALPTDILLRSFLLSDHLGNTPFHTILSRDEEARDNSFYAILFRFLDIIGEIADGQEALLQENCDGKTILHIAASIGDEKSLSILLMYTSAVNRCSLISFIVPFLCFLSFLLLPSHLFLLFRIRFYYVYSLPHITLLLFSLL